MTPLGLTAALAAAATRDRLEMGRQSRLAKLARCCHPNTLRLAARRLIARTRAHTDAQAPVSCCA